MRPDSQQQLSEDGYVILPEVLPRAEVERIRGALAPLLAATPPGRNEFEGHRTRRVYNLLGKTRAIDGLVEHPATLPLCEAALGHQIQLSIALAIQIHPGETAQELHRDDSIFPVAHPHPPLCVNTMWAIDDFTPTNGATVLVPRSHQRNERPGPAQPRIPAAMPRGSVLVWLGTLWHGGGDHHGDAPRLGLSINYNLKWLRQQENQYLGIPREVARDLSPRLQRLIGYDYYPPFLGNLDGRDPLKVLR